MQTVKNTMPNSFVSVGVKRDTEAALYRAIRNLSTYVSRLAEMREIPELPNDVKLINKDFVNKAITPRIEAVTNDIGLTEDERDNKYRQWQKISATATRYANAITEILEQWPDVDWQWNSEENMFSVKNMDEVLITRCTFDTPEEAKMHYALIQDALAAVKKLREWEQSKDAKTVALLTLVRLTPAQLAEIWHSGDALVNHRYDHLGIVHDNYNGMIII